MGNQHIERESQRARELDAGCDSTGRQCQHDRAAAAVRLKERGELAPSCHAIRIPIITVGQRQSVWFWTSI
jgi:hypothetical protein